jgi:hypothetical protein
MDAIASSIANGIAAHLFLSMLFAIPSFLIHAFRNPFSQLSGTNPITNPLICWVNCHNNRTAEADSEKAQQFLDCRA